MVVDQGSDLQMQQSIISRHKYNDFFFLFLDEYYLVLSWVSVVFSLGFLVTQAVAGISSKIKYNESSVNTCGG